MKRIEFDEELMLQINNELMHAVYEGEPEAYICQKAAELTARNKKDAIALNIEQKLLEGNYSSASYVERSAKSLAEKIPEELYPNIFEWMDDNEISEIDYHGMSIKRIMDECYQRFHQGFTFLNALDIMLWYIHSGCKNPDICMAACIIDGYIYEHPKKREAKNSSYTFLLNFKSYL